jgi:hypothetical protein
LEGKASFGLFKIKNVDGIWAWWVVPVIPALRRLKQEDLEF